MATFIHATGSRRAGTRVFRVYGSWGQRRFPGVRSKSELYDLLMKEVGLPPTATRWELVSRLMDLNWDFERQEWVGDFATQLRRAREKKDLTQAELANRAGIAQGMVAMLEADQRKPTWDTVRRLGSVLETEFNVALKPPAEAEQLEETD